MVKTLGFAHEDTVYVSSSFETLKDKALELGAHRINGEPGTGRDLRKIIQPITADLLVAFLADFVIVDLDRFYGGTGTGLVAPVDEPGTFAPDEGDGPGEAEWIGRPKLGDLIPPAPHAELLEAVEGLIETLTTPEEEHDATVAAQREEDAAKFDPPLTPALKWASEHQAAREYDGNRTHAENVADDELTEVAIVAASISLPEELWIGATSENPAIEHEETGGLDPQALAEYAAGRPLTLEEIIDYRADRIEWQDVPYPAGQFTFFCPQENTGPDALVILWQKIRATLAAGRNVNLTPAANPDLQDRCFYVQTDEVDA
jgi:hypothetical protein